MKNKIASIFWFCFGAGVFIAAWEAFSVFFGNDIILPGPFTTIKKLIFLVPTPFFLKSLALSFLRVMLGIIISVPLGISAGLASGLNPKINFFLKPLFTLVSSTPVMSVILILFLWLGSELTPVFTSFLMIFPVIASNTKEAVRSVDPRLLEMLDAFDIRPREKIRCLYLPHMIPYITAAMKSALTLSWKVVAAAEVLVQPLFALGTGMQRAKANLETAELYAWTAATVILASLCTLLFEGVGLIRKKMLYSNRY